MLPHRVSFRRLKNFGQNLRRNLITVPSCDQHNSQKSKDDEFLRSVILMTPGNNEAGQHLFAWKLLPATSRKPHAYRTFFTDKGTVAQGKGRVLQINRDRFDRCIDHLARALFFHAYKRKWQLPIVTFSPNFFSGNSSDDMAPHQPSMKRIEASKKFLSNELNQGENPDVFQYRIRYGEDGTDEGFVCAAIFYGCFEIFSYSLKDLNTTKRPV